VISIIFKPRDEETQRKTYYCHIHKADTGEHLKKLKFDVVGKKKVAKAKLSTDLIELGDL